MKTDKSLKEEIINKIKSGNVKMRPKIYFVFRPIIFVLILALIIVFLVYFLSFIFFILRINESLALMDFGLRGVLALFLSLPWGIISFIILMIAVVETLLFRFSDAYRKPVLFSLFGLIVVVLIVSFLISLTAIHDNMLLHHRNRRLPWMGPFYEGYERIDFRNIHCGKVLEITDRGCIMEYINDPACAKIEVVFPLNFKEREELKVGDIIILAGERKGLTINAFDLNKEDAERFCEHYLRKSPK